ncbi:hypothetical protein OsJ_22878 [Oryza sativa Japonica Group]|uniref:DUF4220 domain-containing protein n=1 Tax=Oryza sativa subsp. japonica TaxID=39947 RepID=A3BG01_ORYSJ|nr:hypothetical protein OsJ_22878 [Oryza sativa Japonica Group]
MGLLKSPRGTVIRIEVLVVLAACMLIFLAVFGFLRRRCTNPLFQTAVMGSYVLSSSLVTYTLGSMQSSAAKSGMYPIWALSLFILSGIIASQLASVSWNLNKMVADYMHEEHANHPIREYDAGSMKGYRYLVYWRLDKTSKIEAATSYAARVTTTDDDAQIICIDDIWLRSDKSLSTDLKDACLSFSLFHLLRRRFFGFTCAESAHPKTSDFVFKGLLQLKNGSTGTVDYIRAFKVIEVELAFMYDFFFTKYALIYYSSTSAAVWSLVSAAFTVLTAYSTTKLHWLQGGSTVVVQGGPTVVGDNKADIFITMLLLVSIALLELLQPLLYWTTIWGRVSFVCQYIRQQQPLRHGFSCCMMRVKELLTKIGLRVSSNGSYWQDMLGQYSLLASVSRNKPIKQLGRKRSRFIKCMNLLDYRALNFYPAIASFKKKNPVDKPIKLSPQVKEAVAKSLLQHAAAGHGNLTNGVSSLKSNGAHHLLWACDPDPAARILQNQTPSILIWHIATCCCEKKPPNYQHEEELKNFQVATALSRYSCVLHAVGEESVQFLRERGKKEFDAMALQGYEPPPEGEPTKGIFESGLKLGKQLEEMPEKMRWKVLADFWPEMLLYISPSDNVKEHIQRLAKGGEFITHLWALLSHAGILERPKQEHHPGSSV